MEEDLIYMKKEPAKNDTNITKSLPYCNMARVTRCN